MFDEPEESPSEQSADPKNQAREKTDEFRMHAEFAAVFEGKRKFDAEILPALDSQIARDVQKQMGKLEKSRMPETPLLPESAMSDAAAVLKMPAALKLSTNDYHIHRRPGEVMIIRWLQGQEVDKFYERLQAHFDAALNQYRDEERQSKEWKQDPKTLAYLDALDEIKISMAERYLRDTIRKHKVFVLSTQSADELDILHLCDFVMGVPSEEIVGPLSAPGDAPTESERAWFFKLFSLRGTVDDIERMCFFTYLQKSDGDW